MEKLKKKILNIRVNFFCLPPKLLCSPTAMGYRMQFRCQKQESSGHKQRACKLCKEYLIAHIEKKIYILGYPHTKYYIGGRKLTKKNIFCLVKTQNHC